MRVVIIGGGVAGLSIGWRLAQSGCETVVLERAIAGRGATWASGGMIAAASENADSTTTEARFAYRAAALWPDFAAEIERQSGQSIAFRRDGSLLIAETAEALETLSLRARDGASIISAEDALRLEPMLRREIAGALRVPSDAQVDNRALGTALALAFVKAGGTLQVDEAVVRLEMTSGIVQAARTPFALYEGDVFVIASGAWSGELSGIPSETVPRVIPVKGEMIALKPRGSGVVPTRLIWGSDIYLIPRHDRLFAGATTQRVGFDTSLTEAAEETLVSAACALLPELAQWELVEHWAGLRPGSPDDLPLVGETALPGLFVASGQFRNGILFAPAIADAMHSLIVERRLPPEIAAFDPKRFAGQTLAGGVEVR